VIEDVLDFYNILQEEQLSADEVLCTCPFHDGDSGPKLQVNIFSDIFHCWSCKAGGNYLKFIMLKEGFSTYNEASDFYTNIILGGYNVEKLHSRLHSSLNRVNYKHENNFQLLRNQIFQKVQELIISVYDIIPENYFVTRFNLFKLVQMNRISVDLYFKFINERLENEIQLLDVQLDRLSILINVCTDENKLYSYFKYVVKVIEWQKQRIKFVV